VPEVLEVELTRRGVARLVGRTVVEIEVTDPLVVQEGVDATLPGSTIAGLDRHGKQLVVLTDGPTVGVHLGMTGRILVDDQSAIGELARDLSERSTSSLRQARVSAAPQAPHPKQRHDHMGRLRLIGGSRSDHHRWDRWVLRLDDGTRVRFHDPRRLGRVVLDPDVGRLGPDVLTLRRCDLAAALSGRRAPLKAVLLDQHALAGLGNMLVDEVLWWCGIDPRRPAGGLTDAEVTLLHLTIRRRLGVMLRRGGSHTGALSPANRGPGARCPRDGDELARTVIGGRTTVWCRTHQR